MSEQNTNEPTNNEPNGQSNDGQEPQPTSQPEPQIPRSVLEKQGAEWSAKLNEMQAQLEKYQAAEAARQEAKLRENNDFQALEEKYKKEIEALKTQAQESSMKLKRQTIENLMISNGLDMNDPIQKLAVKGAMMDYDGQQSPDDWFSAFRDSNRPLFERQPNRPASPSLGAPEAGATNPDHTKLVAAYKAGRTWATERVIEMNNAGQLTSELAKQLGIPGAK